MTSLLIIEDDTVFADRLARNLGLDGFEAEVAHGGEQALTALASRPWDAVVCDIRMPGIDGIELLKRIRNDAVPGLDPEIPVLMLTSVTHVETAVQAMLAGASDYLTKEAGRQEIVLRLRKALRARHLADENKRLRAAVETVGGFQELVGESTEITRIKTEISQVAPTRATVLISGETGVGKELVARAIHRDSGRTGEFIDVNGALLPDDTLLQSELFGHERGAFTDAKTLKKGKLELADGGTLLIDEVGELSPDAQAKLLRVLETMTFTRVGGTRPLQVDVRIIAATNRNLHEEVKARRFRDDLYYRLNVFPIEVPPLRHRRGDIPGLARFFLQQTARRHGFNACAPSPEAVQILKAAEWPGNARELRNICERLVIRARGADIITAEDIRSCGIGAPSDRTGAIDFPPEGISLDEIEKQLVLEALRRSEWRQTDAARLLGISTDRMNNRVKKYGLTHPAWRVNK